MPNFSKNTEIKVIFGRANPVLFLRMPTKLKPRKNARLIL